MGLMDGINQCILQTASMDGLNKWIHWMESMDGFNGCIQGVDSTDGLEERNQRMEPISEFNGWDH